MFTLPQLNFDKSSLEPYMSAQTLDFHHGKHHQAYIDNLNKLIENTNYQDLALEEIITKSKEEGNQAIFNNAGQTFNHNLFWQCLSPKEEDRVMAENLQAKITASFGSVSDFKQEFTQAALSQFGSGWVWLVKDKDGKLKVQKTANADNPLTSGLEPILALDVWEHSYYLDYQNKRADFVQAFLDNLVNWNFVASKL